MSKSFATHSPDRPEVGPCLGDWPQNGFPHHGDLYQEISVPVSWVDEAAIIARKHFALREIFRAWNREEPGTPPEPIRQDHIDFGNLPELVQQSVLRTIAANPADTMPEVLIQPADGGQPVPAGEWLANAIAIRNPRVTPEALEDHSIPAYQKCICRILDQVANASIAAPGALDAGRLLDECLQPADFHFLTAPGIETRPEADLAVMLRFKAVVFDVYGTLRIAPAGGVKPDAGADPVLRRILTALGCAAPDSPSAELHAAVLRHNAASHQPFPEVDLRDLWNEVAAIPDSVDRDALVIALESAWHPSSWMPGADVTLKALHRAGIPLGLLSNAQCDMLPSLGELAPCFAPDLTVLSYQHGIAKPSSVLFELLAAALARRGIHPEEALYIGNDPLHDIAPAAACGFKTAWFTGHPDSLRPGYHPADFILRQWPHRDRM